MKSKKIRDEAVLQNFLQGQLSSIEVSEALQPSNTLIDVRTSEEHFQGAFLVLETIPYLTGWNGP